MLLLAKLLLAIVKESSELPHNICTNYEKYIEPKCERIFIWNNKTENFISLFDATLFANYSSNLNKTVRIVAGNMLPYITSNNSSQKLGGFLGDVWQMIETTLGFTSNVSSVYYDTGLEIITSGKADIMLHAVVNKPQLVNIKYSQPYFYNWYHLFLKTPEARASSLSYLKTFDVQLWFVTLAIFAILTTAVWITTNFLNSVCRIERPLSFPSSFLGVVSGFINQGFDLKLLSYSGRMQVMFALILGVVLYSAMNAVLVAQLAVFDIPFPFKSVDDIAEKRTHSLCLRTDSFVYNNFTNENKEILPKWRNILNGPNCKDIISQENLASILCNDAVVILENRAVMDMILKNYDIPCKIMNNQERLFETGNSFLLLKTFALKEVIKKTMQKIKSNGILQRLEYIWIRREDLVNFNFPKSPQVTLDHIKGILLMYLNLVIISLLVLVLEIFYFRYHSSKRILMDFSP